MTHAYSTRGEVTARNWQNQHWQNAACSDRLKVSSVVGQVKGIELLPSSQDLAIQHEQVTSHLNVFADRKLGQRVFGVLILDVRDVNTTKHLVRVPCLIRKEEARAGWQNLGHAPRHSGALSESE